MTPPKIAPRLRATITQACGSKETEGCQVAVLPIRTRAKVVFVRLVRSARPLLERRRICTVFAAIAPSGTNAPFIGPVHDLGAARISFSAPLKFQRCPGWHVLKGGNVPGQQSRAANKKLATVSRGVLRKTPNIPPTASCVAIIRQPCAQTDISRL